ncbi:MAG: hypothetical protein ACI8Q1_002476 [Parvicella sp.]|jgi:hypothetical protein
MKKTLVLVYNSYRDPLVQNLILKFIEELTRAGTREFFLITFEQPKFRLDSLELRREKERLLANKIFWYPLNYHSGRFLLLKKGFDFISFFVLSSYLMMSKRINLIISFANIAGSFGYLINLIFRQRHLIYSYEPHSEFMKDVGLWDKSSIAYRVLNKFETLAGINADYIITGTGYMQDELVRWRSRAKIWVHGTPADRNIFYFTPELRKKNRTELGVDDGIVNIVYVGKFDGLYYSIKSSVEFFKRINDLMPQTFFTIISPTDHESIVSEFLLQGLSRYHLSETYNHDELRGYLNGGDFGIILIPPTPSQKFRSPTKTAEYLLSGLPVMVNKGISEDDKIVTESDIGFIIPNLNDKYSVNDTISNISRFIDSSSRDLTRENARKIGLEYRSLSKVISVLEHVIDR